MPDPENKKPSRPADTFVSKIVTDPANPPDLTRLVGYKGASSEPNCTRLYLNPELNAYADIQDSDIVHEEPVPTSADPLGAVTLWVKRDAKLSPRSTQQTAQAAAAAPQPAGYTLTTVQSPAPHFCIAPTEICTIRPSLEFVCTVRPTPLCTIVASPFCTTPQTLTTVTQATTQPTTAGTYAPQPQAAAFAAQAAAPQTGAQPLPTGISHILCGAPSPPPLFCITPTEICTIRPSFPGFCTIPPVSLLCTVVASPNCPTPQTLHTTIQPTTIQPTTIQPTTAGTYGPQPQAAAFAAQAAAPQTGAQPLPYPSVVGPCGVSQQVLCPTPSVVFQCPSQHPALCTVPHSAAIHLCTTIPSPDALRCTVQSQLPLCIPTGPMCVATTQPATAGQTGIQPYAAQAAAPQAAAQLLPTTTVITLFWVCSGHPICRPYTPYTTATP